MNAGLNYEADDADELVEGDQLVGGERGNLGELLEVWDNKIRANL